MWIIARIIPASRCASLKLMKRFEAMTICLTILVTTILFLAEARNRSRKPHTPAVASRILGLSGKICYDQLGCFEQTDKWVHAGRLFPLPEDPKEIGTNFLLSTRKGNDTLEQTKLFEIDAWPEINLTRTDYDPKKRSTFLVHGFQGTIYDDKWVGEFWTTFLNKVDGNLFLVDWAKGAETLNYLQAAGNTRVVGAEMARFAHYLWKTSDLTPDKIHCIGHSLGAHICGYFGAIMKKDGLQIDWITALDPAGPGFQGEDDEVRVDKSDATFVDSVHTDAEPFIRSLGFGMRDPTAHVDFYMNGGNDQPNCSAFSNSEEKEKVELKKPDTWIKYPFKEIAYALKCSHLRAIDYYISALNGCIFIGYRNKSSAYGNPHTRESCEKQKDCQIMGPLSRVLEGTGLYYVDTTGKKPYCVPNGYKRESDFLEAMLERYYSLYADWKFSLETLFGK